MGGTGALLFAHLADLVITFGALTSLREARGLYWLNSLRLSLNVRASFEQRIAKSVRKCRGPVYCFFSSKKDTYFVPFAPKSAITAVDDEAMPKNLKEKGKLGEFLNSLIWERK